MIYYYVKTCTDHIKQCCFFMLQIRHICDISNWYSIITEVLSCGPCTKAGRGGGDGKVGRWLAWDSAILCQLSEAHQAIFPAILTDK